ncbi:hypothetical protein [Micromonospora sp. CB01531]|uniref:hypothetical protein n=1 Tax=Micromonospora sp. CB01531 TaxID=1718947 RepID=UPI000A704933|nr:hypothetical protein [Micromonospora sp. CB01531]
MSELPKVTIIGNTEFWPRVFLGEDELPSVVRSVEHEVENYRHYVVLRIPVSDVRFVVD